MNDTLVGAIIGAVIASIPNIMTAIANAIESRESRKHEILMKQSEMLEGSKIKCIQDFSRALGDCLALSDSKDLPARSQAHASYLRSFEALSLYVSDETFSAMRSVVYPCGMPADDPSVIKLNACLRFEMRCVFSGNISPENAYSERRNDRG